MILNVESILIVVQGRTDFKVSLKRNSDQLITHYSNGLSWFSLLLLLHCLSLSNGRHCEWADATMAKLPV